MRITPTLSLSDACSRSWDVIVVGAGPAGSLLTRQLARNGIRVLLVDRAQFPRSKVCGSCLNGRAIDALQQAGLHSLLPAEGAISVEAFALTAGGSAVRVPLTSGVVLSREALDAALIRSAVGCGAAFLPGTMVQLLPDGRLQLTQPEQQGIVTTSLRVAADGLGSTLMQRAGVRNVSDQGSRIGAGAILHSTESFYLPGVIYMCVGRAGYVGLVRLEDNRLDIATALDPAEVRNAGGPAPVVKRLLESSNWPVPGDIESAGWRGTPPLTRHTSDVAGERLFALGDATGYVEPFTGEGMAWALGSAIALAPIVVEAVESWHPGLATRWSRLHRQIVTRRQGICRVAAKVLRHPRLAAWLVAGLSWCPGLARPVISRLNAAVRSEIPLS